ncbi:MAG TPA: pentapeptide repeat-containing protein [Solirubrobacterales bacterium]
MADRSIQPAAHEDAKNDARLAAKWLIASFAGVGAILVGGISLSSIGELSDLGLAAAGAAFVVAVAGVIAAVSLVADVLTPSPTTLKDLAEREERLNATRGTDGARQCEDPLVEYLEADPTFLQGIAGDAEPEESLIRARSDYERAVTDRYVMAEAVWDLETASAERTEKDRLVERQLKQATMKLDVVIARVGAMHETVRRLERITAAQQTVQRLRALRPKLTGLAVLVALSTGVFAYAVGSAGSKDQANGPTLEDVNLSGANLREANFGGLMIRSSNFRGTDLEGAQLEGSTWMGTICPDGSNSDRVGHTCAGHLGTPKRNADSDQP